MNEPSDTDASDNWQQRAADYRRRHFSITAKEDPFGDEGDILIELTYNGSQWSWISLKPDEILPLIVCLMAFLPEAEPFHQTPEEIANLSDL